MTYVPTLVDYFLEVSIKESEHTCIRTILQRIPSTDRDHFPLQDGVRYFCLPDKLDLRLRQSHDRFPSFHSFTLTGGDGSRAFGFALTTFQQSDGFTGKEVSVPHVYCFISHFPFISLFKEILGWIYYANEASGPVPDISNLRRCIIPSQLKSNQEDPLCWPLVIADFVLSSSAPHAGSVLDIRLGANFMYQHKFLKSPLPPVDDMCFQLLFQHLSVKNIVLILNCMLLEQRILIHSSYHGLLMPVSEALCALLFPFVWEHVYIPMLPMKLIDYLQAPVPFFMGVHTSYLTTKIGAEVFASCVVIHLDKDKVVRPIHSHLPDWSGLDQPQLEPNPLPKFPPGPISTLIAEVKAVLHQYEPTTHPHTAATNRIRARRKARTSDALSILHREEQEIPDTSTYAAPEVELIFGPGPLGITFESTHLWLLATGLMSSDSSATCNASAVVKSFPQLQNGLPGPAALSGLIAPGSYLLSVNDHSTLHLSFEATCDLLRHEPRPLVLRFQNATQLPYQNALQFAARVRASSLLNLPPNTGRPTQNLDHVPWVDAIRIAFTNFSISLFHRLPPYISIQPTIVAAMTKIGKGGSMRRHSIQRYVSFNREGFLRTLRPGAFYAAFLDTQAFAAFANDTAMGRLPQLGLDSPFVDLFHECVELVKNGGTSALSQKLSRSSGDSKHVPLVCSGISEPDPVAQGTTKSTFSRLFQDLELEIDTAIYTPDIILVESPQKRNSATRHLEMMICGAALEAPQANPPVPPRRRSLSDSSMIHLEDELLQPVSDENLLEEKGPQDDGSMVTTKSGRLTKDKLWAGWRRQRNKK